ncbi:MAG: DUF819 family protein [Victivallales bacterium]|nr:DUF819 family protein [Victivallales bacterium]
MIEHYPAYIGALVFIAGSLKFLEKRTRWKIFEYLPPVVLVYLTGMLAATFGVWKLVPEINASGKAVRDVLLPAMIYLMLLSCDLRRVWRLGGKMLLGFFSASFTIALGFIVVYFLFKSRLGPDAWKALAALCGSWMGGTANMVAIQGAFKVSDAQMGYTLMMDTVVYSAWVMVLLLLIPAKNIFNRWCRADGRTLEAVGVALAKDQDADSGEKREMELAEMLFLCGLGLGLAALSGWLCGMLPKISWIDARTMTILVVTVLGVISASTPLGRIPGSALLGNTMLYIIVAIIGSRVVLGDLAEAPLYLLIGFMIVAVHAVGMLLLARLFRLDLFTCGVASLANIGGVAAAPVLAAAYSPYLVGIGVLMALLGYAIGTGGGLVVGWILSVI